MTTEENKVAFRRWVEGVNTGNLSVIDARVDELFIDSYPYHDPGQPAKAQSHEVLKSFWRDVLNNMPDFHITIEDMIGEGDELAIRMIFTGTDSSTGKLGHIAQFQFTRFAGGKLAESWGNPVKVD